LWGGPGIGKSSLVYSLSERLNAYCEVLILSITDPADFGGLPVVDRVDGRAVQVYALPSWFASALAEAGRGRKVILFFDEIDKAPELVRAGALRLIYERALHNVQLPDSVAVLAAANPVGEGGLWELDAPLANRFLHLCLTPDPAVFVRGMVTGDWLSDVPHFHFNTAALTEALARARGLVGSYIHSYPSALHAIPADPAQQGRAWPSPRTWEYVARVLAISEIASPRPSDETIFTLIAGAVGREAAIAFTQWRASLDLPAPEELLENPTRLPRRQDQILAAVSAVASFVKSRGSDSEVWEKVAELLVEVAKAAGNDVAFLLLESLKPVPPAARQVMVDAVKRTGIPQIHLRVG
jgi:hypothetical protein